MIVAYSFVTASPRASAGFAAAMAQRSRSVERFPGFVRFEFRREVGRRHRYVIVTWWQSRDDLRRYLASDEHRTTHEKLPAELRAEIDPPRVEIHEVLEASA